MSEEKEVQIRLPFSFYLVMFVIAFALMSIADDLAMLANR